MLNLEEHVTGTAAVVVGVASSNAIQVVSRWVRRRPKGGREGNGRFLEAA